MQQQSAQHNQASQQPQGSMRQPSEFMGMSQNTAMAQADLSQQQWLQTPQQQQQWTMLSGPPPQQHQLQQWPAVQAPFGQQQQQEQQQQQQQCTMLTGPPRQSQQQQWAVVQAPFGHQQQHLITQAPQVMPNMMGPIERKRKNHSGYGMPAGSVSGGVGGNGEPRRGNDEFDDDDTIEESTGPVAVVAQPEPDPMVSSVGPLVVNTRVEYTSLPKGKVQDVFGLVTVQSSSPEPTEIKRQPMDIVCVLDVSGSMRGSKIRQVQDATRFLIDQSDRRDRLSIVTFNNDAKRPLALRKMNVEGKDSATCAVMRLAAGGGTSIAAGLDVGLAVMEQRRQKNKVSALLLLTDGQDSLTRPRLPALLQRAAQANCAVYAFGFGADHDAKLLSDVAEQAHTPFSFVEDTQDKIREAFAGAVGGLSSVVAQDVRLRLNCHAQLKALHTPFVTSHGPNNQVTVTIPDMFAGERKDVLVEFTVPSEDMEHGPEKVTLLDASAQYLDLQHGTAIQTLSVQMEVKRVQETQPEEEPDEEVCLQRERVEVTQALQRAMQEGNRGQFQAAQEILSAAEQRMRSPESRTPASVALGQQLQDARLQMQSQAVYEQQGRAMMSDAYQMHSVQRCTNMNISPQQTMYCLPQQGSMIQQSRV